MNSLTKKLAVFGSGKRGNLLSSEGRRGLFGYGKTNKHLPPKKPAKRKEKNKVYKARVLDSRENRRPEEEVSVRPENRMTSIL